MKKITCLIFLMILLLQSGGLFLYYNAKQFFIQSQIHQELTNNTVKLIDLSLSLPEFKKYKISDSELEINGSRYDIKSIHITGNRVIIKAFDDIIEKEIIAKIKDILHFTKQSPSNPPNKQIKQLNLIYLASKSLPNLFVKSTIIAYSITKNEVDSLVINVSSPPPKFI